MNQENSQQNPQMTMGQALSIVFGVCHIWALPMEMLLRRNFGRRYIDAWVFAAALWPMFFCAIFMPTVDPRWSGLAFFAILFLAALRRGQAESSKAEKVHSQYSGYPNFCDWVWRDEPFWKSFGDAAVTFLLGLLASMAFPSMGMFLFGSAFALSIKHKFIEYHHREQLDNLRDAMYEQQDLGERFQNYR